MDEEDIPKISDATPGEACSVILVLAAIFAGLNSLLVSWGDPSTGFAALAIVFGLSAITLAILTVGKRISDSK